MEMSLHRPLPAPYSKVGGHLPPHIPLVMIVDDHADTRDAYVAYFQFSKMEAVAFSSAEVALANLDGIRPDIIVCDVKLPGMSGLAFLDHLKGATATAGIPFVLVTGGGDVQKPTKAAQLLLKPVLPNALAASVRDVLKLH